MASCTKPMSEMKRDRRLEFRKNRKERTGGGGGGGGGDCRKTSSDSKGRRGEGRTFADNGYVE